MVYGLLKKKKPENNRVKIKIKIKGKAEDIKKMGINKGINNLINKQDSLDSVDSVDSMYDNKFDEYDEDNMNNTYLNEEKKKFKSTFDTLSSEDKKKLIDSSIWD